MHGSPPKSRSARPNRSFALVLVMVAMIAMSCSMYTAILLDRECLLSAYWVACQWGFQLQHLILAGHGNQNGFGANI